jgi:hypothetical protein
MPRPRGTVRTDGNFTGPLILRRPTRSCDADGVENQMNEVLLDMAERHIAQLERQIARQEEIVEELERDGHRRTAKTAPILLTTFRNSLRLAREQTS